MITPDPAHRLSAVDPALEHRVNEAVTDLSPRYRQLLRDLVRIPSISGDETAAQHLIATVAADAGLDVHLHDVAADDLGDHPDFASSDVSSRTRPNVTAVLEGTSGGRSLALSGHVDVVPLGGDHLWTRDPFGGEIEGDRLYGRGALDMKGGLIASLHALDVLRQAVGALPGTVVFESVIEEECSGNGMLAARLAGQHVDAAILPEVSGEEIQLANPGVVWFEVTVRGHAEYVGLSGRSVNAIDLATQVIEALRRLPAQLAKQDGLGPYQGEDAPFTLNIGTIRGGDWPSSVPVECQVGCRMSFPPEWPVERAQREIIATLSSLSDRIPWLKDNPPAVRWHGFQARGHTVDPEAPIVQTLVHAVETVGPGPARLGKMYGTADARYFADVGIPAIYYGPAGGGMHAPDEWVSLTSVERVARVLARTAMEWCR